MQPKTIAKLSTARGARRSDQRVGRAPFTFETFRRRTRGLPPSRQLEAFQALPEEVQQQAWQALRVELDREAVWAVAA